MVKSGARGVPKWKEDSLNGKFEGAGFLDFPPVALGEGGLGVCEKMWGRKVGIEKAKRKEGSQERREEGPQSS